MADVFISYSRKDAERVEMLVRAIEAHGLSVWWDRSLEQGANFGAIIREEISKSAAVVVCWSEHASQSRWVREEADEANHAGKYVGSMIAQGRPALGFATLNNANLTNWDGSADDLQLLSLLAEVGRMLNRPDITERADARKLALDDAEARMLAEKKARETIIEQERLAEERRNRARAKSMLLAYYRTDYLRSALYLAFAITGGWVAVNFYNRPSISGKEEVYAGEVFQLLGVILATALLGYAAVRSFLRVREKITNTLNGRSDMSLSKQFFYDLFPRLPAFSFFSIFALHFFANPSSMTSPISGIAAALFFGLLFDSFLRACGRAIMSRI